MKEHLNFVKENSHIINALSNPLSSFGITTVAYFKFSNNSMLHLCNNIPWYESWLDNKIYIQTGRYQSEINILNGKKEYFLLRDRPQNKSNLEYLMQQYKMSNIVSMYLQPHEGIVEMFGFASNMSHSNLFNFYLNNKEFLIDFARDFRTKMYPIIDQVSQNNIYKTNLILPASQSLLQCTHLDLYNNISKKIFLNFSTYITKREFESWLMLSKGLSIKEIGNYLRISPRTVEIYINNIKNKLRIYSTSQLIQYFHKYTF